MTNISKLLPACGFVIAVALVGITSAFKDAPKTRNDRANTEFSYNPPSSNPYSVANVENVSNWIPMSSTCPTGTAKACTLEASPDNVDASGDEPVLLSSEHIVAALNASTQTARVTSTTDGIFDNRSN